MTSVQSLDYIGVTNQLCSELVETSTESDKHFTMFHLGDRIQKLARESPGD